jgi:glycosyltransferase involved in cell wall biosynthesis
LYVGQLIRGKGVDLLLRSLTNLDIPFRVVIVGRGNAETDLRATARQLGLSDRVEFAGWVDNDDLHRHYMSCDLVAIPSRWPEPFGLVGLEAMRHCKPVVAFNVGGLSDWLQHEHTGFLVPPGDVQGYSIALRRLLSDRVLCSALGTNGATQFHRRFRFHNYIHSLEQLLLPSISRAERPDGGA